MTVYPAWSATENNLSFVMSITSDVGWASAAPVKAAQTVKMAFESVDLVANIPTLTSDPDYYNWVTGAGDTMTTTAGDTIIFSLGA